MVGISVINNKFDYLKTFIYICYMKINKEKMATFMLILYFVAVITLAIFLTI